MAHKSQKKIQANLIRIAEKEAKEKRIQKRLSDDEQGLNRRKKSGYNDGLSLKNIRIIKIVLLVSLLPAFFLYSVLLLPIVLLYGLLYFVIKRRERALNYGMRKDLWITLPKFDTVIALVVIIMAVSVVGISAATSGTQNSMYAGMNESQIVAMLQEQNVPNPNERAREIIDRGMALSPWERAMFQGLTLLTGQRELFQTVNQNATNLGGANRVVRQPSGGGGPSLGTGGGGMGQDIPEGGGTMVIRNPDGSTTRHTGNRDELMQIRARYRSSGIGNVPLMAAMSGTFRTVSMGMLIVILLGGAAVVIVNKKDDTVPKVKEAKILGSKNDKITTDFSDIFNIRTIKRYTDSQTGEVFEIDDFRLVPRERGEEIIRAGYAIEYISKTQRKNR